MIRQPWYVENIASPDLRKLWYSSFGYRLGNNNSPDKKKKKKHGSEIGELFGRSNSKVSKKAGKSLPNLPCLCQEALSFTGLGLLHPWLLRISLWHQVVLGNFLPVLTLWKTRTLLMLKSDKPGRCPQRQHLTATTTHPPLHQAYWTPNFSWIQLQYILPCHGLLPLLDSDG